MLHRNVFTRSKMLIPRDTFPNPVQLYVNTSLYIHVFLFRPHEILPDNAVLKSPVITLRFVSLSTSASDSGLFSVFRVLDGRRWVVQSVAYLPLSPI